MSRAAWGSCWEDDDDEEEEGASSSDDVVLSADLVEAREASPFSFCSCSSRCRCCRRFCLASESCAREDPDVVAEPDDDFGLFFFFFFGFRSASPAVAPPRCTPSAEVSADLSASAGECPPRGIRSTGERGALDNDDDAVATAALQAGVEEAR